MIRAVLKHRAGERLLSSGAGVKDQTEETRSEVNTVILRAPKSPKYPGALKQPGV